MPDLIIRNGYVLTMNPGRQVYADGTVAVEESRIVEVAPTAGVLARLAGGDVIAAGRAWMERAGVRPHCPWPIHS